MAMGGSLLAHQRQERNLEGCRELTRLRRKRDLSYEPYWSSCRSSENTFVSAFQAGFESRSGWPIPGQVKGDVVAPPRMGDRLLSQVFYPVGRDRGIDCPCEWQSLNGSLPLGFT